MGRDSDREHKSWLLRPKPRTLGDAMQRGTGDGPGAGYDAGQDAEQTDWQQLPMLPKWPPLPEEDPFASARPTGETGEWAAAGGYDSSEQQTAPPWDTSPSGAYVAPGGRARSGTLWQRFHGLSRRSRLGLIVAAVSVVVLVCTLASVAALGSAFLNQPTGAARGTQAPGLSGGQTGLPTTGNTTPTALASPNEAGTETPAPATLTLAFTCASGSIGGTGQVCVHTLPNASVSLSVRYCDGNDAKGGGLRGAASANSSGDYTWRWKVTTRCAGTATATVTAKSSGQTVTQSTTFSITR